MKAFNLLLLCIISSGLFSGCCQRPNASSGAALEKRIAALEAEIAALKAQQNVSLVAAQQTIDPDIQNSIVSAEERCRRAIRFEESKKQTQKTEPNQSLQP